MRYPNDPRIYDGPGSDQRRPACKPTDFHAHRPPLARHGAPMTLGLMIELLDFARFCLGFAPDAKGGRAHSSHGSGSR